MRSPVRLAAWSAALFLSTSPALAAQTTLFNSLDADGSSTEGGVSIIWGSDANLAYLGSSTAAAFTVTGGTYAFKSAEFVLATNAYETDVNVRVQLFADDADLPGTLIETIDYTGRLPRLNEGPPATVLFSSALHPTLAEGATYWLAVSFPTEGSNGYLYNNSLGLDIPAATTPVGINGWSAATGTDPAFRVIGSLPEPATAMLLAAGALAMVRRQR